MANYNSQYVGARIDEAVTKVLNPSSTPTSGSTELITSGAVADALALKADLNSPALTGTPTTTAPDASSDSRRIATTAFVQALGRTKAPLDSPDLQGTPTTTAPEASSNSRRIATTAFVKSTVNAAAAGLAPLDSPAFTGTPTAPTYGTDNRDQIATVQYVGNAISERIDNLVIAASIIKNTDVASISGNVLRLLDNSAGNLAIVFADLYIVPRNADIPTNTALVTILGLPPLVNASRFVAYSAQGEEYALSILTETVSFRESCVIKTAQAIPRDNFYTIKSFYLVRNP